MNDVWTLLALKEHIDQRFTDTDRAIELAADVIDRRLEGMNEFREQIQSERRTLASLERVEALEARIDVRVTAFERWQARIVGALALTAFVIPTAAAVIVYLLTRGA